MTYEPSTEDIRAAWYGLTQNTDSFDLWLIKERERVINLAASVFKKDEQDRIIKLLEEHHNSFSWQHYEASQDSCHACESLALIKREESNMQKMQIALEGEEQ